MKVVRLRVGDQGMACGPGHARQTSPKREALLLTDGSQLAQLPVVTRLQFQRTAGGIGHPYFYGLNHGDSPFVVWSSSSNGEPTDVHAVDLCAKCRGNEHREPGAVDVLGPGAQACKIPMVDVKPHDGQVHQRGTRKFEDKIDAGAKLPTTFGSWTKQRPVGQILPQQLSTGQEIQRGHHVAHERLLALVL